jgi:hypothetical protein
MPRAASRAPAAERGGEESDQPLRHERLIECVRRHLDVEDQAADRASNVSRMADARSSGRWRRERNSELCSRVLSRTGNPGASSSVTSPTCCGRLHDLDVGALPRQKRILAEGIPPARRPRHRLVDDCYLRSRGVGRSSRSRAPTMSGMPVWRSNQPDTVVGHAYDVGRGHRPLDSRRCRCSSSRSRLRRGHRAHAEVPRRSPSTGARAPPSGRWVAFSFGAIVKPRT